MSDFIPRGMRLAAEKLSVISRNRFQLQPVSSTSAAPGGIITVKLPANVLIHSSSFKMHAVVQSSTSGTAGTASAVYGKLPQDASSLINRLEVTINGIQVQQGSDQYNTVCRILRLGSSTRDRDSSIDRTLAHSAMTSDDAADDESIVFSDFREFLCNSSAGYLPTDLLGQIQIRITLAGAEVLSNKGHNVPLGGALSAAQLATIAAAPVSYQLNDIYFTIDTVAVSPTYGEMLRSRIMSTGYVPILYKEYYTYGQGSINTSSYSTRFALSSGSIDKLYAVQRRADFVSRQNTGVVVTGAAFTDANVSDYFNFTSFDSAVKRDGTLNYVWQVNNVQHPQHRAYSSSAMFDLSYSWAKHMGQAGNLVTSREHWHRNCAVFTCVLNLPEEGIALMSGYDSRGSNSQFSFDVQGLALAGGPMDLTPANAIHSFVVAECTQELRVGAGLSLAVSH